MPKKMEQIRRAIKRENPSFSESKTYAMAWNKYNQTKEGKARNRKKNS